MVGRMPDSLTMKEQLALAGKFIAMEVYLPETQPARKIAAIGKSPADCIQQLSAKGLNPGQFEFRPVRRAML